MAKPLWKPGTAPYAAWLKTLTKEEYDLHLIQRAQKKSMRQAMKEVVEAQQAQWIATFNNAAVTLMKKAIEDGDTQAFCAIYDRFVGKPEQAVDVTSNGNTLQAPTIIFNSKELPEWENDDED